MATTGKGLPRSLKDASLGFDQVSGKPTTYPPTIGTSSTTAMAGNKVPTVAGTDSCTYKVVAQDGYGNIISDSTVVTVS